MKITVFTSNRPRHINLIKKLADIAETVYVVQECATIFPGKVKDFFDNSAVMQDYFRRVIKSEETIFGSVSFLPENVRTLSLRLGDLSLLPLSELRSALKSDYYVVFGSSFIKGDLIQFLMEKRAINIHMGVSPYFRGSSCNFWASYMGRPELVGATIHLLSEKLDAGDILYHALPKAQEIESFDLGMIAVEVAHNSLVERIKTGEIKEYKPIPQEREKEIRYTRNIEFDDTVARDYLENLWDPKKICQKLNERDLSMLLRPYIK